MDKATYCSILSGTCATVASMCGKLSGLNIFKGYFIVLRLLFFALMILSNGGVWTLYVKALQSSKSSLSATVLSSASNYLLSAVIGYCVFGEITSLLWWSGLILVLFGLILIAKDQTKGNDHMLNETKETVKCANN